MTWLIGKNKAFSFIELMVAMVILCAGLVLIIEGFIIATSVLNTAQNYIAVARFFDNKMQEMELSEEENNGIKKDNLEGNFSSASRNFGWNLDISGFEKTEELDLSEDLNEARLTASWKERNHPNDLTLVAYMKNKKENE